MEGLIKKALGKGQADYLEIRLEEKTITGVTYAGKELDSVGANAVKGGNVRALYKGGWGFVSFNSLDELDAKVAQACRAARLVGKGKSKLAKVPKVTAVIKVNLKDDPRKIPLDQKVKLAKKYNGIITDSKGIISSSVRYEDVFKKQTFANTEGTFITEERMYCGAAFAAVAKDGANVQRAHDTVGGTGGYHTVLKLESKAEATVKDARDLLKAEKVSSGKYTVVMDPKMCGVFAHEAFGHLSEADFISENSKLKKMMTLGIKFGVGALSILDDATIRGQRGHYCYDEEGVAAQKNYLIKNGILVGRLHSRQTAGRMNEKASGSARAISYQFKPIVRMGCTYIEPRDCSFQKMIGEIKNGLYVVSALGGMTELEMFTFSAMKAYLIKNGKLGPMVRDVILTGNVFETLKNIDAIGDDLELHGGLGGCGKDGQMPLPVSDGGPHIRVKDVVVGGK
ncbi:TldD/PmbA family protein [candidate division TA06 bacterium]|uniref:TldD/PmbA family protein n=1 Tax=candidate division TA06 bacterium TaxID=2250710 RepID=A0A933I7J4_UNCT6|nr:TldD/PmbA family protein [candidate division TA06 bacterium]